jgi:Na+-transporting methylmalonyl-CoA/oxaloacetate decarboxylase gamma subunit
MNSAVTIFLAGIGGVFAGMGLLYIAIRVTSVVVARLMPASDAGKEGA